MPASQPQVIGYQPQGNAVVVTLQWTIENYQGITDQWIDADPTGNFNPPPVSQQAPYAYNQAQPVFATLTMQGTIVLQQGISTGYWVRVNDFYQGYGWYGGVPVWVDVTSQVPIGGGGGGGGGQDWKATNLAAQSISSIPQTGRSGVIFQWQRNANLPAGYIEYLDISGADGTFNNNFSGTQVQTAYPPVIINGDIAFLPMDVVTSIQYWYRVNTLVNGIWYPSDVKVYTPTGGGGGGGSGGGGGGGGSNVNKPYGSTAIASGISFDYVGPAVQLNEVLYLQNQAGVFYYLSTNEKKTISLPAAPANQPYHFVDSAGLSAPIASSLPAGMYNAFVFIMDLAGSNIFASFTRQSVWSVG